MMNTKDQCSRCDKSLGPDAVVVVCPTPLCEVCYSTIYERAGLVAAARPGCNVAEGEFRAQASRHTASGASNAKAEAGKGFRALVFADTAPHAQGIDLTGLKRYFTDYGSSEMVEDSAGDWVLLEDVQALLAPGGGS